MHFEAQARSIDLQPWVFFDAFDGPTMGIRSQFSKPTVREAPNAKVRSAMAAGECGCYLSHVAVWRGALAIIRAVGDTNGGITVFEDDAVFMPDFRDSFAAFMRAIPDDWDLIHFGGHFTRPVERVNDRVNRLFGAWGTYGYIARASALEALVARSQKLDVPIDSVMNGLMPHIRTYGPTKKLVAVAEFPSDVGQNTNPATLPAPPPTPEVPTAERKLTRAELRSLTLQGQSSGRAR